MTHPGPWELYGGTRFSPDCIVDAEGDQVIKGRPPEQIEFEDDDAERLVLAAPELLETVKALLVYHDAVMAYALGDGPEVDASPPHDARALIE